MLRRNLARCPRNIKDMAYKAILRPQVEYASAVWDPYSANTIKRFVCHDFSWESSVSAMLTNLKWPTLEQRRAEARLCMMHRIINCKVDISEQTLFQRTTRASRRSHSHQFHTIRPQKDCFKYSFVPRTIIQWNNQLQLWT